MEWRPPSTLHIPARRRFWEKCVSVCFVLLRVQTGATWQRGPRRGAAPLSAACVSSPPLPLQMVVAYLRACAFPLARAIRARFLFSDDTSNRGQPGMTTTRSRPSLFQKLNGEEPLLYHCCRCLGNTGIRHSGKIKPAARTRLNKEVDL